MRTYRQILKENVFTFFNFLNLVLFLLILLTGSYKNGLFMGTILFNTAIGLLQELRAKKIIDDLAILTESKAVVLREGKIREIPLEELAVGDRLHLKAGDQVPADVQILKDTLEVDESLLTGEADSRFRQEGSKLYAGSFVTAGAAWCRVLKVGEDCWSSAITRDAKAYRGRRLSGLQKSLDQILHLVSGGIVPLGLLLFLRSRGIAEGGWRGAVVSSVAGIQGMIPEGLILLTSLTLSVGAAILARRRVLVQELHSIETLSEVDVLCLDKTGTLTTGELSVERILPWEQETDPEGGDAFRYLRGILKAVPDENATARALRDFCDRQGGGSAALSCVFTIPFSSERKYSGAVFEGEGTWLLGAAGFLFPEELPEGLGERCARYASQGLRVLVLASSARELTEKEQSREQSFLLPKDLTPRALILLSDVLRPDAADTIAYFYDQGVDLKVISGDDPRTVSAVAARAGVRCADRWVDASAWKEDRDMAEAFREGTVFGRVSPKQKKAMVRLLRQEGHRVAMTGDGVNDVPALKESDCGLAIGTGSSAARSVSQLVLLDGDFSAIPEAVHQGRRVIHNIRRASSMFLIKTIFSALLVLASILLGEAYPFQPVQITLIGTCAVGIPTFFLSQEPDHSPIAGSFLREVLGYALPYALTIGVYVTVNLLAGRLYDCDPAIIGTVCVLVTGWVYAAALREVYAPLNPFRGFVIYGAMLLFYLLAALLQGLLSLQDLPLSLICLVIGEIGLTPLLCGGFGNAVKKRLLLRP